MGKSAVLTALLFISLTLVPTANATNGDTLIGVAPAARAMGGAGVAAPQDAISAIFANPAAMCFGPYCPGSQVVFASTFYDPTVKAKVNGTEFKSHMGPFIIPAIGLITPIDNRLRFGVGMYGITGMGVDYRNDGIDLNPMNPGNEGDIYTQLQVMKFAPNLAYLITPDFSVGVSLHLLYGALDLGEGMAHDYGYGAQLGAIYKLGTVSFGASYVTAEEINHKRVSAFGVPAGTKQSLTLESPRTAALGVAWRPMDRVLVEADLKWLNWADAEGYKDFDWSDQWVYSIGAQYKDPKGICLRAGYNYAKSPVKVHENFDSAPTAVTMVQGKPVNTAAFEYLRIIGFPAVAEHHLTFGVGYRFNSSFETHLGAMYSLSKEISQHDNNGMLSLKSELQETSYDLGFVWNFF